MTKKTAKKSVKKIKAKPVATKKCSKKSCDKKTQCNNAAPLTTESIPVKEVGWFGKVLNFFRI